MTKLDETFVAAALKKHPEAAHFINTLAEEVRRLELLGGRYEEALTQIGRMENAPVIARMALHPMDEAGLKAKLGPNLAEQIAATGGAGEDTDG